MSNKRDYYDILGVSKTAPLDEIKKAYRRLAKKYHPDISSEANAQERFKEINEAYQVLSDKQKRHQYDQFGHAGVNMGQNADFSDFFKGFDFENVFEGFSSFFGNQRQRPKTRQFYTLDLTFSEAMQGIKKSISFEFEQVCAACNGTGADSPADLVTCGECNGKGFKIARSQSFLGMFQQRVRCPSCRGQKTLIRKKCANCRGQKFIVRPETLELNIPRGVNTGQQMRFPGKGRFNFQTNANDDLYIEFNVGSSPLFKREDQDLYVEVPVSYLDSLLGNKIVLPTIDGEKVVRLEPGVRTGRILRLRNYGAYDPTNQRKRGDQYVKIIVYFPNKLSKQTRTFLQQLANQTDFQPNQDFIKELKKKNLL